MRYSVTVENMSIPNAGQWTVGTVENGGVNDVRKTVNQIRKDRLYSTISSLSKLRDIQDVSSSGNIPSCFS